MTVKMFKYAPVAILFNEQEGDKGKEAPVKVQLLRVGLFSYYSPDDMEINQGHLLSMVNNFENKVRGVDCAIDYGHNMYKEAAGWIENLFLSNDGNELWATIKWTPRAAKMLEDKEYRYISSEFSFNFFDNEGLTDYGPTLFGAGLTNRPFVKNMEPLVEMSDKETKMNLEEMKKKLDEQAAQIKTLSEKVTSQERILDEKEKKIKENEEAQAK